MPRRFVILKHDHPFLHWDLLLEEEHSARTWRLLRRPCLDEPIAAEPLPAHRLMYLDFEGPVSNDRGAVERVISGLYEVDSSVDAFLKLKLLKNFFATSAVVFEQADGRIFVTFSASTPADQ